MTFSQTNGAGAKAACALLDTFLILAPGILLASVWFGSDTRPQFVTDEWGPVELLHQIFAGAAAVLFFESWRRGTGAVQVAGGALALLAAAAFVREIDVKRIAFAVDREWLVWLGERGLQEILLVLMTFPIFVYLYINRSQFMNLVRLALRWQAWALYLSGCLILVSVYLDGKSINGTPMVFWEELTEVYGFVFMTVAAWRHLRLVDDPVWKNADTLQT